MYSITFLTLQDFPAYNRIILTNINLYLLSSSLIKPPQTNSTNDFPNHGIADKRLVIL